VNTRIIRAIVEKDLRVVRRSRALMTPLIVLPILLMIVFPTVFTFLPRMMGGAREAFTEMFNNLPDPVKRQFGEFTEATWIHIVHTQMLAPLMLLVPFMVANVIAADGFAGERERKTLEPLLYTPATDAELFVAKLLAAWIPAVMIAFIGAFVYAVIVNIVAWPVMHRVFFPNTTWVVMVLWMAPAFAALGLAGMLLVSLRVRGMQEATQLGGLFVLPVIALVVGEVRGAVLLGPWMAVAIGSLVWVIAAALLVLGVKRFRRTSLVGKL
jgi:ABC-2 type transport system permease protein